MCCSIARSRSIVALLALSTACRPPADKSPSTADDDTASTEDTADTGTIDDRDTTLLATPGGGTLTLDGRPHTLLGEFDFIASGDVPGLSHSGAALFFDSDDAEYAFALVELDDSLDITMGVGLVYFTPGAGPATVLWGTATDLTLEPVPYDDRLLLSGTVTDADMVDHSLQIDGRIGAGSSTFALDLEAGEARLDGSLGSSTYDQLAYLVETFPEVHTIALSDVPGSVNDEANMETGRMLRAAGLDTRLVDGGAAYSGGVDLFCAGVGRSVGTDPTLGVHSWSDGENSAHELPEDHPGHVAQVAFFTEMLGPELGPDFYWFTIYSAPADDIHVMSDEEIDRYGLLTD